MWFQNRRARWRRKENTVATPGRRSLSQIEKRTDGKLEKPSGETSDRIKHSVASILAKPSKIIQVPWTVPKRRKKQREALKKPTDTETNIEKRDILEGDCGSPPLTER